MFTLSLRTGGFFDGKSFLTSRHLVIPLLCLAFTFVQRHRFAVESFLPLQKPLFDARKFSEFCLLFFFQLRLSLKYEIFRFQPRLFEDVLGLTLSLLSYLLRLLLALGEFGGGHSPSNDLIGSNADDDASDGPQYVRYN